MGIGPCAATVCDDLDVLSGIMSNILNQDFIAFLVFY
jgi:hypothetical protein